MPLPISRGLVTPPCPWPCGLLSLLFGVLSPVEIIGHMHSLAVSGLLLVPNRLRQSCCRPCLEFPWNSPSPLFLAVRMVLVVVEVTLPLLDCFHSHLLQLSPLGGCKSLSLPTGA
ncbi:hypothetical protein FRX31_006073 [Thalictrum thalictroides]|uniref:Uncharacterized protein n=1 Tax=Thalictrum thalictroides TaxID=46969 RepID=A0A7J6X3K0_THATH|nr:hypothetical protein FRX31_006073 [Thalictrum thalictroides]